MWGHKFRRRETRLGVMPSCSSISCAASAAHSASDLTFQRGRVSRKMTAEKLINASGRSAEPVLLLPKERATQVLL